jgi:hypothetical protein
MPNLWLDGIGGSVPVFGSKSTEFEPRKPVNN